MEFKISIFGLIALILAVVALIGVFLAWATAGGYSATGWEFFTEDMDGAPWYAWLPLVVLILSIVTALFAILGFIGIEIGDKQMTMILFIVLGALILILSYLTYNRFVDDIGASGIKMGAGIYVEIVAGAALIVTALLNMFGVLPENK